MKMRISIILMALTLLVAYTIPAMSADCAQQRGKSCGKAEMACGSQCGERACEGECAEGCECGCGGECGEACGKGCNRECGEGNECVAMSGCGEGLGCAGEKKYVPMHGQYREGKRREYGMGMGKRYKGSESYYLAEKRDLQRQIDKELKMCPCQKMMLAEANDEYTSRAFNLQRLYFKDRSISIEDLNHRLTRLNHSYDRQSRMMLSEFQDAIYPEHMWMLYSSPAWSKGYHPGPSFVLRELLKEYERALEKRHGMRCEWEEGWRD